MAGSAVGSGVGAADGAAVQETKITKTRIEKMSFFMRYSLYWFLWRHSMCFWDEAPASGEVPLGDLILSGIIPRSHTDANMKNVLNPGML